MEMRREQHYRIALWLIRNFLKRKEVKLEGLCRELGRIAKEIGVEQKELHGFFLLEVLPDLISEAFGDAEVTVQVKRAV